MFHKHTIKGCVSRSCQLDSLSLVYWWLAVIVKIFLMGSRDLIAWRDTPNAVLVSLKLLCQLKMPFKCPYQNELLGGTKENNTILPIKRSLTLSFYITPNPHLLSRQINDFFWQKASRKKWLMVADLLSAFFSVGDSYFQVDISKGDFHRFLTFLD